MLVALSDKLRVPRLLSKYPDMKTAQMDNDDDVELLFVHDIQKLLLYAALGNKVDSQLR